jgi:hypothetical protein
MAKPEFISPKFLEKWSTTAIPTTNPGECLLTS